MIDFHFLRPLWFLALIPALWLLIALWRKQSSSSSWNAVFDQQLLVPLWLESPGKSTRLPLILLACGWLLAIFILAGPVWERQPEQIWRVQMSRVVILDLSPSMDATDVSPSRMERARFKIMDILARSTEGRTGLVVFAGEAHTVTPLTEDNETIKNLISALSTEIMPAKGDFGTPALQMAGELLNLTGLRHGEMLLISDGIADPATALAQVRKLREQGFRLSVLGIGTEQGGTIHHDGVTEFVRFNPAPLQELARAGGGTFSLMTTDEQDLNRLLPDITASSEFDIVENSGVERWIERGTWLLPLLLLIAAMAFRRGWLIGFACLLITPPPAYAFGWQDLWLRSDQQAQKSLNQGDAQTAAQQFNEPNWRGMALHETGDYEGAAQAFSESDDITAKYNQGNALARTGDLEQAIAAYREVLQQNPVHEDAKANLELLERLLQQQSQDNNDTQQEDGDGDGDPEQSDGEPSEDNNDNSDDSAQQDNGDGDPEKSPEEAPEENYGNSDDSEQQEDDAQSAEMNDNQDQPDGQSEEQPDQQYADNLQNELNDQDEQKDHNDQQPQNGKHDTSTQDLADEDNAPLSEEDIALEQWLRQIPEDPSGLLRRKFMLEHIQRKQKGQ